MRHPSCRPLQGQSARPCHAFNPVSSSTRGRKSPDFHESSFLLLFLFTSGKSSGKMMFSTSLMTPVLSARSVPVVPASEGDAFTCMGQVIGSAQTRSCLSKVIGLVQSRSCLSRVIRSAQSRSNLSKVIGLVQFRSCLCGVIRSAQSRSCLSQVIGLAQFRSGLSLDRLLSL